MHPRYIDGARYLIDLYALLQPDAAGNYLLTERGRHFLENDPETVREIDDQIDGEKLLDLLFKHDIGIKKRSLDLYELDEEYLTAPDDLSEAQQVLSEELG